jgi:hypothetical protein
MMCKYFLQKVHGVEQDEIAVILNIDGIVAVLIFLFISAIKLKKGHLKATEMQNGYSSGLCS